VRAADRRPGRIPGGGQARSSQHPHHGPALTVLASDRGGHRRVDPVVVAKKQQVIAEDLAVDRRRAACTACRTRPPARLCCAPTTTASRSVQQPVDHLWCRAIVGLVAVAERVQDRRAVRTRCRRSPPPSRWPVSGSASRCSPTRWKSHPTPGRRGRLRCGGDPRRLPDRTLAHAQPATPWPGACSSDCPAPSRRPGRLAGRRSRRRRSRRASRGVRYRDGQRRAGRVRTVPGLRAGRVPSAR